MSNPTPQDVELWVAEHRAWGNGWRRRYLALAAAVAIVVVPGAAIAARTSGSQARATAHVSAPASDRPSATAHGGE